ncbi:putative DNA-binding transcriptional regulator YafY [Cohnella thailandensis]|uniref:YafY family transcriptional regulator n=1 Tax=Cohnella thailandensis TaxID=557557 RepID=A0A841SYN7_9BACL|nr:YafY family transcriptional regulator [Cohnella thailandensis]MBP1976112.1 putative DNA-binding transcriptional regulator YafY [Cohnella thailandensis]
MRLDRLLGITLELMAKRRVTATELAAKFEVSARTVYRDVDLINQAGIPVASFSGADGGFELMGGFFLTRQQFSVDDFTVIYTLLKAMEGTIGSAAASPMRKLASLHPALANDGSRENLILDMSAPERERELVQELYRAIRQSRVVRLAYASANGTFSERSVEPLNLLWEKGAWYLEGDCRSRKARRYFRLSRIARAEATEETFVPRRLPEQADPPEAQGIRAHLRFDPSVRTRVLEQFPGECEYLGERIEVRTVFYTKEYALSLIASYGTKVDILAPDELRDDVIAHIEAIRQHYASKREGDST